MHTRSAREPGRWMLREIREQPGVIARLCDLAAPQCRALGRRLRARRPSSVVLAARGSSDNAALYGRYLIETQWGLPTSLAAPSVVTLYHARLRLRSALVVALSQSGASVDIVEFLIGARARGALTVGITNHERSPLAHAAHETILLSAGPERSVAATKTYTAQLTVLSLLIAEAAGAQGLVRRHRGLAEAADRVLGVEDRVCEIAHRWRGIRECLVTSRGYNFSTAREAALKLKETCYVAAEPMSSADLLHGPIAIVEPGFPALLIAPPGRTLAHLTAIAGRLRRRRAGVITVSSNPALLRIAEFPVEIPAVVDEPLSPHLYVLPLQLLAYHLARARGLDPDRPRGLRKITRVR
jgi:glucosamine--fructose-6-phosphate aminotransferase (isomerizing)